MKTKVKKYKKAVVRTAMTLLLAAFSTCAWATDFITDVMLIGGSKNTVNNLKTTYTEQGWTVIGNDLNAGAGGDYIFLLYKTANCQGLNSDNYITDFYISNAKSNIPNTLDYNGITYTLTSLDGSSDFVNSKGDLNSHASGATIHLYFTKQKFDDSRAVTGISFDNSSNGAVGVNGGTSGYDLNTGSGGNYIYMHVTTTTALPVLQGSGSSSSPFLISNAAGWASFIEMVNFGTYAGSYFKLAEDIPTASDIATGKTALTTMAGTSSKPFKGHFLGNGKTITVNISSNAGFSAPFSHVNGATIEDLTVNGSVACSGSSNHGAGLVGSCDGGTTVISGCTVAADVSGSGYVGGIVGHGRSNTLNISNSVFSGTVSGFGNYAGGLVGWCEALTMTIANSLFSGSFQPASGGLYHPIACKNGGSNATAEVSQTYYLKEITPTASGNNIIAGAEGIPVSTTCINGEYDTPVAAPDGNVYYAPTTEKNVITEAPEGMVKHYFRSGQNYIYYDNIINQSPQNGIIEIVFAGNNEVYLKEPVCYSEKETYVKGLLVNNKIIVPLPQTIALTDYGYNMELAWVNIDTNSSVQYADRTTNAATFTVDGNTISLDNSSQNHVLGCVWDDDDSWYGVGDFESVYTETTLEDPISPPDGIVPVPYTFTGSSYYSSSSHDFSKTIQVVKDGCNVYIQGLATGDNDMVILPDAWAKGTLNGTTLTIPKGQYMGFYSNYPIFLIGYKNGTISDITFTYNAEEESFTLDKYLLVNSNDKDVASFCYTEPGAVIKIKTSSIYELVTVPKGAVIEDDWTLEGSYYPDEVCKPTEVAFFGNDIYVKGISYDFPDAWIKGTIDGNTVTFASGQYVGTYKSVNVFIVGYDNSEITDIVFTYDNETGRYNLTTPYILETPRLDAYAPWGYYDFLRFYKGEPVIDEVVQVPEDLETELFTWEGKEIKFMNGTGGTQLEYTDFVKFIRIGFDGNDVYAQGLCKNLPDAWVKGTLMGNTVTFSTGQFFGIYNSYFDNYPFYMIGYDNKAVCDVVFSFDAQTKTFTTDTWLVINRMSFCFNYVSFYKIFSNNVWTRLREVAGKPANPSVEGVLFTGTTYPRVQLTIPVVDIEGNYMNICKLYYRLYSDIEHDIRQLVFSPDNYDKLSETLYDIPYTFDDDWDIYEGGSIVYLYEDNLEDFNRIGVQSIYYGGDVCNTSDVVWYKIKDYANTPTGIAEHKGEGVKSVRYFNAAGMPCEKPTAAGLYIVVKEMEDGTVKVEKWR